ncbi:unnamed protein product, partial [Durusdinium trenchii]
VQQPTEDLGKQEQEAVHTESVAEVQQESPAASPQHSTTPTITQVEEARVHQPAEDLSKQEQEAVHMESVAEVQQEWGAMNNCSRYIPLYIRDEYRQTLFAEHRMCKHPLRFFEESPAASPQHSTTPTVTQVEEARVQQPAEDLSKEEQEAVHTESVAEVQQESPAASPQHSTTPTVTQAVHTESVAEVQQESPAASPQHSTTPTITQVKEARVQQPTEDLSKQEQEAVHTESVAEVQ